VNRKDNRNSSDIERMFVGLDLHKNYVQAAVVEDRGMPSFFEDRMLKDGTEMVMEPSSTWYHVYGLLSQAQGNHIALSSPAKTKAIASARVKADRLDARVLANLLRGGYIPERYVPLSRGRCCASWRWLVR